MLDQPLVLVGDGRVQAGSDVILAPDAALVMMENGSACLLDMAGSFYAVPPSGALMLRETLARGSDAAAAIIAETYGIDPARAGADLRALLDDLMRRGILQPVGAPESARQVPLGARILAGLLVLRFRLTTSPRRRAGAALTLARISLRLFGWAATRSAWQARLRGSGGVAATAIDTVVRQAAARHPLGIDCKERALACWVLARSGGLPAQLVIGVRFYPLSGHAWCALGETVLGDDPAYCARHLPVFRYAG